MIETQVRTLTRREDQVLIRLIHLGAIHLEALAIAIRDLRVQADLLAQANRAVHLHQNRAALLLAHRAEAAAHQEVQENDKHLITF
jgi:hypothetical protein